MSSTKQPSACSSLAPHLLDRDGQLSQHAHIGSVLLLRKPDVDARLDLRAQAVLEARRHRADQRDGGASEA
ncbi:MAG: hypothetical protein IPG04_39145 [Polyangiaceae bacterium]|nr:hypothetical protein [Polyangiaceae bacterium]